MTGLAIIVAVAGNGVIGNNNTLPWKLPGDLQNFKRLTMGKPVVMGRRTYESIGRPLPGRTNIVVTRNESFTAQGVQVAHSLDEALAVAYAVAGRAGAEEVMVIGGAEIYAATIPRADRLYITEVHASVDGDAFLPTIDWACWREVRREHRVAQSPDLCDYSFVCYERVPQPL